MGVIRESFSLANTGNTNAFSSSSIYFYAIKITAKLMRSCYVVVQIRETGV